MFCNSKSRLPGWLLLAATVLSAPTMTGCQVSVGGQTLPSAYFLRDDIQYFPRGPEFKLTREAAALKEARESAQVNRN
jgi:hypothetical protein